MKPMNLQDNQQYVTSARDNVDVINKGLIDIKSIQSELIYTLKNFMKNRKHPFHSLVMALMKKMSHVPSL